MYRLAKAKREALDYILVIKAINDKLGNSKPVKRTFKSLLNLSSLPFIFKGEAGWFNNKYDAVRIMQIEVSTDEFFFIADAPQKVDNIQLAICFLLILACIYSPGSVSQKFSFFVFELNSSNSREHNSEANIPSFILLSKQIYHRISGILFASSKYCNKHHFLSN